MFLITGFLLFALYQLDTNEQAAKEKASDESNDEAKSADPSRQDSDSKPTVSYADVSYFQALIIGLFQAVAILPGISRSGSTIVGARFLGLDAKNAATFSFLLAIPAIAGAMVLESVKIFDRGTSTPVWLLAVGLVVSFLVGLLSLWLLIQWLGRGRLYRFAYYVIPLGFAVVCYELYDTVFF